MVIFYHRVDYQNPENTYNKLIVEKLVSDLLDDPQYSQSEFIDTMLQKAKATDPNSKQNIFKSNIFSNTTIGEVTLSHRLEAKILKKAVDLILNNHELSLENKRIKIGYIQTSK